MAFCLPSVHSEKDTGVLVDLDGGHVSLETDDFPDELGVPDPNQLVHSGARHLLCRHHCNSNTASGRSAHARTKTCRNRVREHCAHERQVRSSQG